ncbi:MAG: hypothetical protein ACXABY_17650 [Candidatus Thorarchaeota archaeon]|jgi:hypothetical protein
MSEVARQYNLIGETLRQGIGDLLQGQAAGKALDIRAMQMGIAGEQAKSDALHRDRQFKLEQKKFDENAKRHEEAKKTATYQLQEQTAQQKLDAANAWATDHSIGIDTDWEMENLKTKWLPELRKAGYNRKDDGSWWKGDKRLKAGEIKNDTDIAGVMLGNMDPSVHVRKQHEIESLRLQDMIKSAKEGTAGPDDDSVNRMIATQKSLVDQLEDQLVDMDNNPIKYLNAQINTLGDFMAGSLNPSIHMTKFKELSARRAAMVEERIARMKIAGNNPQTYQQLIYDSNGEVIYKKYLPKSITPMDDPDIRALFESRKKDGLQTYIDQPAAAKRLDKMTQSIVGSMGGSISLMKAYRDKGPSGAADLITGIHNAGADALGLDRVDRPEIDRRLEMYDRLGIDPKAEDFSLNGSKQKVIDALNKGEILLEEANKLFDTLDVIAEAR